MTFIDRLNNLLFDKNLSKMDLSKKADIPYTTICGWFNNRLPDYNALIKLSNYFHVSADYLLGRENDFELKNYDEPQQYTHDELQLIAAYRKMSQGKKQALFSMLDIDENKKSQHKRGKY